jgi:transposase-like protein
MIGERGVSVHHSTIYRWVHRYPPEIEKRLRWQWRGPGSASWWVDETYVKVRGQWAYLYRARDKHGNSIEFYLSSGEPAEGRSRARMKHRQSARKHAGPTPDRTVSFFSSPD